MTKFYTDPKTGRMSTTDFLPGSVQKRVDKLNADSIARQLLGRRDMLAGNTQFHADPQAAPPEQLDLGLPPLLYCVCGSGLFCDYCALGGSDA